MWWQAVDGHDDGGPGAAYGQGHKGDRVNGHPATDTPRLRDGLGFTARVFAAVWAGWALLGLLGVQIITAGHPVSVPGLDAQPASPGWHNLLTVGNRGDALWYQRIATGGYRTDDASAAFFPLFPAAIHVLVSLTGVGPFAAALVIAQLSFFGALAVLYALTARELGVDAARLATRYLAVFPTAFFFLVPYSEAPFLLLALLTFWYARANRWWAVLVPATLAALTRSVGVVLVAALAVEALVQWRTAGRRLFPRLLASLAPAVGLALYGAYWAVLNHDLMAPVRAQHNWQRVWASPTQTLAGAAKYAWQFQSYWLIDVLIVGLVLVTVLAGARLLPGKLPYLVYAVASLLLPLSNPFPDRPLMSVPRFMAVVFPAFWVIAVVVKRRRLSHSLVIGVFCGGYALLGLLFMNNYAIF